MARNNRGKKSFFERLTGTINVGQDDEDDYYEDEEYDQYDNARDPYRERRHERFNEYGNSVHQDQGIPQSESDWQDSEEEGQLAIDLYQTPTHLIIQTMVAGVLPENLDVSITRERCTITGKREGPHNIAESDYFNQELYWGSFSRTIDLPQEVEVEEAEAIENQGLLIIRLPKLNTEKKTKLEIRTS